MSFRKIAEDRAGRLVARWRTEWGKWVDHWSRYCPGKSAAKVHADVPGLCTRLALAKGIADEIEAALIDQEIGFDQVGDKKEAAVANVKPVNPHYSAKGLAQMQSAEVEIQKILLEKERLSLKSHRIAVRREEIALKMDEARLKELSWRNKGCR